MVKRFQMSLGAGATVLATVAALLLSGHTVAPVLAQDKAAAGVVPLPPQTNRVAVQQQPRFDPGEVVPLPPRFNPEDPSIPARDLFSGKKTPAPLASQAIGYYTHGCLAGAEALPVNGPTWQVMRLSRNRNWGHPTLVAYLERLAARVPKISNWPGLLIGDMAQPRGGPMLSDHLSHQLGLDVDIWLTPMPNRELTAKERETMSAPIVVAADRKDVNPKIWTPSYAAILKAAAEDPAVERVLVNAAIKKALCRYDGKDRAWLEKIRPWWGHDEHFHVRLSCPKDSPHCQTQPAPPDGDGCSDAALAYWFKESILHPPPPKTPPKPRPPQTMKDLPSACREVLDAKAE